MYIYHYHAQHTEDGKVVTVDGILRCLLPIKTMDSYREVKAIIGKDIYPPEFAITSLSLLHVTEE